MKIGLVGFSGSGKSTVFQWLTGARPDPAASQRGQVGVAKIPDERLDWLSRHFQPKKTTYASLELVDTPGLLATERQDNPRRLAILREAGGLLVVLRGLEGNPAQELKNFRDELIFADLEVVTNRISRLQDQLRKPKPAKEREADQAEIDLLQQIVTTLESGRSAGELGLTEGQEKAVRSFQLLTLKPQIVLLNRGDDQTGQPLPGDVLALAPSALQAPVKLELELAELPEPEQATFMKELGLTALSRTTVLRQIYYGMGQIIFFTIGEDECRAWTIKAGDTALTGAAQIHTDFAEGFVRAEIVPFEAFQRVGSMKEAKAHGVYRLEGKNYVVQDGDIMHILANK
jgi:ribosome-binding ATPase YchF (GTP1/OBG family)